MKRIVIVSLILCALPVVFAQPAEAYGSTFQFVRSFNWGVPEYDIYYFSSHQVYIVYLSAQDALEPWSLTGKLFRNCSSGTLGLEPLFDSCADFGTAGLQPYLSCQMSGYTICLFSGLRDQSETVIDAPFPFFNSRMIWLGYCHVPECPICPR